MPTLVDRSAAASDPGGREAAVGAFRGADRRELSAHAPPPSSDPNGQLARGPGRGPGT